MRTFSAQYQKGDEPPRRLAADLRLLLTILSMACHWLLRGRQIRRRFRSCRQAQSKLHVEDLELP